MLQVFRDSAHKWFVKVLFWLLVLSFGLWGIGDVVYKFLNSRPIAKVGKRSISHEDLSAELQKQSAQIQMMARGQITPEQLRAIGIHKIAMDSLVKQAIIQEELEELNLGVSDHHIRDVIHSQKAFQEDGKFDANRFVSLLHNRNITEAAFLKELRFNILEQQYMASLAVGAQLPGFYKQAIIDALTSEFVFAAVEIKAAKIKNIKKATTAELNSFYDQHRNSYAVPELRDFSVVKIDNKILANMLGITEKSVKASYDEKKDSLQLPERRAVKCLSYDSEEKAKQAHDMALKGIEFEKINNQIEGGQIDDLGLLAKAQLAPFVADKIFALKSNKCSDIVQEGGMFNIFFVSKIEEPRIVSFEEAKGELEKSLIQEQKGAKFEEIRNQIDDGLAAGKNLKDIASAHGLAVNEFNGISAQGANEDGHSVLKDKDAMNQAILQKAFSVEQGMDSGFVDVPGEGAFVLFVNKVNHSYIPEMDKINSKVEKDYEEEKRLEEVAQLAHLMANEAKSVKALMDLASKHDCNFSTNHAMSRLEISKNDRASYELIPPGLAEKAFLLSYDTAISDRNGKGGYTVVMLQKVNGSKSGDKEINNIKANLDTSMKEGVIDATTEGLRVEHFVEINQEMLAQMAG